ncbi:MAG: leucine-rich repeat protein [Prevotellaceae bacterium]|jgi:hypothetical protein|nr:leucine-rich repeat protein [Prevotellaceae bacterium]
MKKKFSILAIALFPVISGFAQSDTIGFLASTLNEELLIAASDTSGTAGTLTWTFNAANGTLTVTGNGSMPDYSSSTMPWFNRRLQISVVYIEDGVTSIGNYAFYNYASLTAVNLPNSLRSINNYAFWRCSALASLAIPNSVTNIGSKAIDDTPFYNSLSDGVVYFGNVLYKYKGTMPDNTSINIAQGTVSISPSAFQGFGNLVSVSIPSSVIFIGNSAFDGTAFYSNLPDGFVYFNQVLYKYKGTMPANTDVNILQGTLSISPSACNGLSGIISVFIPNSVTTIGNGAFDSNPAIKKLTIGKGVTTIGQFAFSESRGLDTLFCWATTPPSLYDRNVFNYQGIGTHPDKPLYVPCSSLSAYQNDQNWNYFQLILKPVPKIIDVIAGMNFITVTCSGVTNTYEVYRSDDDDNPVYTATNAGNEFSFVDSNVIDGNLYCYRVKTIDNDCYGDFSESVCTTAIGLNETAQNTITVYPNPATDELIIENSELREGDMVSVHDMSGRNIHNSQFTTSHSINVSTLSAGIYFVKIGNRTEKFVKK